MKILLIGGSGFIGPYVVSELLARGDEFATFGRGAAATIMGDRQNLSASRDQIARFGPETVIDLILSSRRQATELMDTLRGVAHRVVAISSADVYRACGILHGFEPGPLQEVPLTEESELRTNRQVYPPALIEQLKKTFGWLDDEYDKIGVEEIVLGDAELQGTVLRLPMIYGPEDRLHRFWPHLKRMDDGRPAILIQEDAALWRAPRGYVENIANAIVLAATDERAAGRVYNVAEPEAFSEQEWVRKIADCVGWRGEVIALEKEQAPPHLRLQYRCEQHWSVSSERIRRELGYSESIPQRLAMERTVEWERTHPGDSNPKVFDYTAEDEALAALAL